MHLVQRVSRLTPCLAAGVAALAIAGLGGCTVRATPPLVGGYATLYADDVPPDVYAYPHVWYDGGYAYLVNDRWYYPSNRGWVILRNEPAQLYSYRRSWREPAYGRTFRQAAPPANPRYYRPSAPAWREGRPLSSPPPPRPERER